MIVTSFKFIWGLLSMSYNEWTVAVNNLRKDRRRWARISRIFGWEGTDDWTYVIFHKAVVQDTLLFVL